MTMVPGTTTEPCSWRKAHYPQALEHFNVVYNKDPIHPIVNKNLGMLLSRLGDVAQAAYFFERAIDFGINEGDVYVQLSEAYAHLGRLAPALHALRAAQQHYQQQTVENLSDEHRQEKISGVQALIDRLEQQLQASLKTR